MKPSRFFNLLIVILFVVVPSVNPRTVSANQSSLQTTGEITGIGQICNSRGQCGEFSITFNPIGGPVTGSVYVNWPITNLDSGEKVGEEILQGTLTGTFDGEDGGVVRGTMATGQVTITYSVPCDTCINETQSAVGAPWEGNLRADGTGNGWIGPVDILWNVTYSAVDFQAGLGGRPPATKTPTTATQVAGTPALPLPGSTITATGQFCDPFDYVGFCGEINITFNPAGGPVTGTFQGTHTVTVGDNKEILNVNGILDGTYAGGDGGEVSGTITSGVWHWTCPSCNFVLATPASLSGYPWGGNLYANGTGNGTWATDSTWTVGFSAADFQAGLAASTQAALPPMETSQEYIQHQIDGISVEMGDKVWSEHEIQLMNEVLSQLPTDLLNKVAVKRIIRYSSRSDNGNLKPNVMGDYTNKEQTIRIFDSATQPSYFPNDATGDTDFKATILHEITHALQYYKENQINYDKPAGQNPLLRDFINVSGTGSDGWTYTYTGGWNYQPVNGNNPPTNYGTTNPLEDMSESVKMYVYDPQLLRSSSFNRYVYIRDKIFGGIEYDNGKQKGK